MVGTVTASDPNAGDTFTFELLVNAGGRFAIEPTLGELTVLGALDFEASTTHSITVRVTDSGGLTLDTTFDIAVTNVNDNAPVITSSDGGASAVVAAIENSTEVTTVAASDPDAGDTVGYSIDGGADAARFTINAITGVLAFATAPDYEAPTDANGDGTYEVTVRASDGALADTQDLAVIVENDDDAPVITSDGGSASATLSISENTTAVTTVVARDDDAGTVLTYSIVGGADDTRFAIDGGSGALSFVSAPDFETPGDAGADNVYDVIVQAFDGTLADTQALAVTVQNANEAPDITSNGGGASAAVSVVENGTAVTTVTAADPDAGTTLGYRISGGADAARFTINAAGVLAFVAAPDFEAPGDADGDNVYDVTVEASDGTLVDTQTLSVTVTDVADSAITGTPGPDTLTGAASNDTILGLGGNDTLRGLAGDDVLDGGAGIDTLEGGAGNDTLQGGTGSDLLQGGDGADTLDGGAGLDAASYADASGPIAADLSTGTASDGDTLANIEGLIGSAFADTLVGNSADNALLGNAGDDTLSGLAGNDVLIGGAGFDTASYADSNAAVNVNLQTGFGSGGHASGDFLNGIEAVTGSAFGDTLTGNGGANTLDGQGGNDTLDGAGGADTLRGGAGADTLRGGGGRDVLEGGADGDVFDFNAVGESAVGAGADLITDFQLGLDDIDLATIDARSNVGGNQAFSFIGTAAFTGVSGQLRHVLDAAADMTHIYGDVNGDGAADFEILLAGQHNVAAGDFVL